MKKLKTTLILIAFSTAIYSQNILDEARQLMDNERYSSAEQILENQVTKEGSTPELNLMLVSSYLEQEKIEDAKTFIDKNNISVVNAETDPFNKITYAKYLLRKGDKSSAMQLINDLLKDKKNKKNPQLLTTIAAVIIEEEKFEANEVLPLLDMAEKKDKNNAMIDILRGMAYRQLGDASNAYIAYQSALKKDPTNVKAHYLLGKIFVTQKNPGVYLEHFTKAYTIDSTYAPVLDELYDHYYYRDAKLAQLYLEKFIANTDYSLQNEYRLADMLYLNDQFSAAIDLAKNIIDKEKDSTAPRLYKMLAYSYAGKGDSATAYTHLENYFTKQDSLNWVAPDFEFRAILSETNGQPQQAITYYSKATTMDTITDNKIKYAGEIIRLNKQQKNYSEQATWLGKMYDWNGKRNNVDLFNLGIAHYNAADYLLADSVFSTYSLEYPDHIFGYYWRGNINAVIDTGMHTGAAIPHYEKAVEIGEKDKATNKAMLLKAYGYLGAYEANMTKNHAKSLSWFEKFLELDPDNAAINKYAETLRKWMADVK